MTAIHRYSMCLKTELYRMFVSPKTYIAVILVTLTYFFSLLVSGTSFRYADSVYYFYLARYSHINMLQMLCLTFSFSVHFLEDWKQKNTLLYAIRSGVGAYALAKVTMCFMFSWIVTFVGIHLFLGLLSIRIPFMDSGIKIYSQEVPYGILVNSEAPYLYIFIIACIISASFAFWAVMGLMISTFCANTFVVVGLPVLLSFYVTEFISYIPLPKLLNITNISFCQDVGLGILGSFIYSVSFFVLLSALAGLLFYRRVKERVSGEVI